MIATVGSIFMSAAMSISISKIPRPEERPATTGGCRSCVVPLGLKGAPDVLYRNLGDGTFREVTAAAGVEDKHLGYGFFRRLRGPGQ